MATLDYSALTEPVSVEEVKAFQQSPTMAVPGTGVGMVLAVVGISLAVAVIAGINMVSLFIYSGGNLTGLLIVVVALAIAGGLIAIVAKYVTRTKWTRWYRISRFSETNGLQFSADGWMPPYPGMLFSVGSNRHVSARIFRLSEPFLDIGSLKYSQGFGENRKVHHWRYIAVKLDRMVPHMILDAKANNVFHTNFPRAFTKDQVLSLEGDFDRHFTLYCPQEYEQDALYVFTPDLMARLIDFATDYDVEIVDDWMFLYLKLRINLSDPKVLGQVFTIADAVGSKALTQTGHYSDSKMVRQAAPADPGIPHPSRLSVNTVAPRGRRLKRSIPFLVIIVPIVAVGWIFFSFVFSFIKGLLTAL